MRVKLHNGYWNGCRAFSLMLPITRDNLIEWFYHKMLEKENVLSPRYGFVHLFINGENKGLYAYEEHFEKQLIEYKHRREGPILKFNEDDLWKMRLKKGMKLENTIPILL